MNRGTPWLPASAIEDVRTGKPIARILADWSADWLVSKTLAASPRWEAVAAPGFPESGPIVAGAGAHYRVVPAADGLHGLASLLLGREISDRECRTPRDRAVIHHLAQTAISALAEKVGTVLPPGWAEPSASNWYVLEIGSEDGRILLRLEAASPCVIALAHEWAGTARPPKAPSRPQEAFAEQSVHLSARIGSSRLFLSEVEALDVGDVLMLDTPLSEPADACIDGKPVAPRTLSLSPVGTGLELHVEKAVSQW